MTGYSRIETVPMQGIFSVDSVNVDPSAISLKIYDAVGTLKETKAIGDLTRTSTGVYTYAYSVPSDGVYGTWRYEFTGTTTGGIAVQSGYFSIDEDEAPLYCAVRDVYRKSGIDNTVISESDVIDFIAEADGEINAMYQKKFLNATSVTEWHNISTLDDEDTIAVIFIEQRPIQSVTSVESYDITDNLVKTFTTDDYWLDNNTGILRLRSLDFAHQYNRIKVVYSYGYTSVPINIKNLSSCIAGMRVVIQQIGGTYDDVTSYSLPSGVSISVGEPYTNMREAITRLEKEIGKLTKDIGQLRQTTLVI